MMLFDVKGDLPVYLKSFHRAARKGAMIVYALVFASSVAVVLYVAATIFQTRQKSSAISDYARQEQMINTMIVNNVTLAFKNLQDLGYGLWSDRTFFTYGGFVGTRDAYTPIDMPTQHLFTTNLARMANNPLGVSQMVGQAIDGGPPLETAQGGGDKWTGNYRWTIDNPTSRTRMIPATFTVNSPHFALGDIFTIPGWRTFRDANTSSSTVVLANDATNTGDVNEGGGGTASNHDFLPLKNFPREIVSRRDLPFGPIDGDGRWVALAAQWRLNPKDSTGSLWPVADRVTDIQKDAQFSRQEIFWGVEEPITNYQLLLLERDTRLNPEGWAIVNPQPGYGAAGMVSLVSSGSNRPKMFVQGSISPVFSGTSNGFIGGFDPLTQPVAALVGATLPNSSTVKNYFDWRVAPTTVMWGMGVTKGTPSETKRYAVGSDLDAPLSRFLSMPAKVREERGVNVSDVANVAKVGLMRQAEVFNSQAVRMPRPVEGAFLSEDSASGTTMEGLPFATDNALTAAPCYANSIIFVRRDASNKVKVSWTRQLKTGLLEEMEPIAPVVLNTVPSSIASVTLKTNQNGTKSDVLIPGLRMDYRKIAGTDQTVVTIDLSAFDLRLVPALGETATQYPWKAPNEIHIVRMGINQSNDYKVVIIGANEADAAADPTLVGSPAKIVTDAKEIRLAVKSSASPFNFRRFVLLSTHKALQGVSGDTDGARLVFEKSGTPGDQTWYGAFLMPWGVTLETREAYPAYPTLTNDTALYSSPKIMGTLLVGRSITADHHASLSLAPDDSMKLGSPADFTNPRAVHHLFTPRYNNSIPAGAPVPMVLPRMSWLYR